MERIITENIIGGKKQDQQQKEVKPKKSSTPIQYVDHLIDFQQEDLTAPLGSNLEPLLDTPFYPADKTLCHLADLVYKADHQEIVDVFTKKWEDWKVVATGKSKKWMDSYFGAAFWHQENRQLVIAHKGTKNLFTDAKADLSGVVYNKYTKQAHMACTFAFLVLDLLGNNVCSISITGHSLGAWLSKITAFAMEYLTVKEKSFVEGKQNRKYHPHTVVFDSPGCYEMLCKLSDHYFHRYQKTPDELISRLDITSYFLQPNYINCKNRHAGKLLSFDLELEKLDKSTLEKRLAPHTLNYHEIKNFLETFEKRNNIIFQVLDWPIFNIGKWITFKIIRFSEKDEFEKYYEFVVEANKSYTDLENVNKDYIRIHYKLQRCDYKTLKSNFFTEDEFIFLENWKKLLGSKTKPSKISEFLSKNYLDAFGGFLRSFEISKNEVSSDDIKKIANRVKRLFIKFPTVVDIIKAEMSQHPEIFEAIYKARKSAYIDSLPRYTTNSNDEINFNDTIGLGQFRSSEHHIMVLKTRNTKDEALRVYNILTKVFQMNENEYSLFGIKDMEYLDKCVDIKEVLKSESTIDNILVIDFESQDDFRILNDLHSTISKTKKKIICICQKEIPEQFNINHELIELKEITLNDLSIESLNALINEKVLLQNRSEFALNDFLKTSEHLTLSKIPFSALEEYLTQGRKIKHNFENDILNRILFNLTTAKVLKDVKIENLRDILENYDSKLKPIIQKSLKKVKFLITGRNGNQDLKELIQSYVDQIIFNNSTDQEESSKLFYETCLKHPDEIIYRLHKKNPENDVLMWIDVYNPDLYMKRKYSTAQVNEEELVERKEKIVLISNTPGMGKSTTLLNLAKGISKSWVFWINLIEAHKFVEKSSLVDLNFVIKFLLQANNIASKLAEHLLKVSLTHENSVPIHLFFDAFDEIQDCENKKEMIRDKILEIIKFLKDETSAKIIISARTYETDFLEKQLGTKSVSLAEIKEKEQIKFCTKFWMSTFSLVKYDLSEIKKMIHSYTERSLRRFEYSLGHSTLSFLGVPLQLRMIVEIFTPHEIEEDSFVDANFNFNLYELYLKFINHKYEIYFNEKMCFIPETYKNLLTPLFQENHRILGMNFLFPDLSPKINYGNLTYLNQIGLAHIHGRTINFIHRTFAECFAAELFVQWMDKKPEENVQIFLVENLFSKTEYAMIQRFISDILAINKKTKKCLDFYPRIWEKITSNSILDDQWSKHLDSLVWSDSTKLMELILENFKYRTSLKNDFVNSEAHRGTIIYEAIKYGDPEMALVLLEYGKRSTWRFDNGKDSFLHLTSENNEFNSVSLKLLKKGADYKFKNFKNKDPFDVAAYWRNYNLFFDAYLYYENDDEFLRKWGTTIFFQAVENNNMDVAVKLLSKVIDFRDEKLLKTFEYGRWNLILMLVDLRRTNHPNEDLKEMIKEFLLKSNKMWNYILELENINITNKKLQTLLHFVVAQNKMDIAQELIDKKQANVNAIDKDGRTPIYLAAEKGYWDFILQSSDKIDFKILGPSSQSLLYMACEQNQPKETIKLIAEKCKEYLNHAESNSSLTPLYVAAKKGHWKLVLYLLRELKADFSILNNFKETLLHMACEQNKENIASYLAVNEIGDVSTPDGRYNSTPLMLAAREGHWNLIDKLINLLERGEISKHLYEKTWESLIKHNGLKESLLRFACKDNKSELALKLIEKGASVNFSGKKGDTAVFVAAQNKHWDLVGKLIELDTLINLEDSDDEDHTLLDLACKNNQTDAAVKLVEKGADINRLNKNGKTPLLHAAENGHWALFKKLVDKAQKIEKEDTLLSIACQSNEIETVLKFTNQDNIKRPIDDHGNTSALIAAKNGHWDLVKKLKDVEDFKVDQKNKNEETLLHFACERNETEFAIELIRNGADINCQDNKGNTPILLAANKDHWSLIEKLLTEFAGEIDVKKSNNDGKTLLYFACRDNQADLALELINDKKVSINSSECIAAAEHDHWNLLEELIKSNDFSKIDFSEWESDKLVRLACRKNKVNVGLKIIQRVEYFTKIRLHILIVEAAEYGNWEFAAAFLDKLETDYINEQDNETEKTLLHLFCKGNKKKLVSKLIKKGADLNILDRNGNNPILIAARCGHFDLITELMKSNQINVNIVNKYGKTLLHYACEHNEINFVRCLIKKGAEINFADNDGNTAIMIAAGNGHWKLFKILKKQNASINKINIYDETLLHLACRDSEKEIARNLIESGLDINFPNGYGKTPPFLAAEFGNWDLFSDLIKLGADPTIRDKDKITILHFACRDNEVDKAIMLIKEKGLNPNATDKYGISPLALAVKNGNEDLVHAISNLK